MNNDTAKRPSPDDSDLADDYRLEPIIHAPEVEKPRSKIGEEAGRARSRGTNGARYQRNPHAAIYAAEPIRSRQNFLRNESNVGKSTVPLSDPPPAPMDNANVLALQRGLRTAGYTVAIVFVTFLD